jgi:hypothetical protein
MPIHSAMLSSKSINRLNVVRMILPSASRRR